MATELKTYDKNTITSGELDLCQLDKEIKDSGHVTGFACLGREGDNILVYGDSFADETALDALVLAHEEDIEVLRQNLTYEIDEAAKKKRVQFNTGHMDLTYINKQLEAQKFKDVGYPENDIDLDEPFVGFYPYVSAYRVASGLATGEEAADAILLSSNNSKRPDAEIEKHRNKRKREIADSSSKSAMKGFRDSALTEIDNVVV